MARFGPTFRLRTLLRLAMALLAAAAWACAPAAHAQAQAQAQAIAPAEDALKQIIDEGNPAYLNWPGASNDREQIGKLYEANGYRLLWSEGEKPTAAAISLLQQLRLAGDRGLDSMHRTRTSNNGPYSTPVYPGPGCDSYRTCTWAGSIRRAWAMT